MSSLLVVAGILLLYLGGEGLVRGAASLGRGLGMSPMLIGLTIVSVGTSSPELAASVVGVIQGAPAVSFGNVIGSNIANLSLVLGLTAIVWPLDVAARFIRSEMPFMLITSAVTLPLIWNGQVGRLEGMVLLVALVGYLGYLLRRRETPQVEAEFQEAFGSGRIAFSWSPIAIVAGVALLVLGAHLLIQGAVGLARSYGISERVIGLTMVALGTSLPELASSLVAAMRHEGDIVLGNLIGSNIFNILFILGTTAVVRPLEVAPFDVWQDLAVMLVVSLVAWIFLRTGTRLARSEGILLLATYAAYITYLFF
jgi:cation:H+ antiporter